MKAGAQAPAFFMLAPITTALIDTNKNKHKYNIMPIINFIETILNQLTNQKSVYDYLQIILPNALALILAVFGWYFVYKSNKSLFKNEVEKEQYYKLKDAAINITNLFFEFNNYCQCFINKIKNIFDNKENFNENDLTTFSYEKMLKLRHIFKLIKIDFPEIKINETEIHNTSVNIDKYFYKLKSIDKGLIGKNDDLYFEKFNEANSFIIDTTKNLTREIDSIEDEINNILRNKAKKLKIIG